jgi:hypothetical protein
MKVIIKGINFVINDFFAARIAAETPAGTGGGRRGVAANSR